MDKIKNFYVDDICFEWDDMKNEINKRKHGISFEIALNVFADDNRLEEYDYEHSENEDRYISIGLVEDVLVVVHTDRENSVRIISARPANKYEEARYYEQGYY